VVGGGDVRFLKLTWGGDLGNEGKGQTGSRKAAGTSKEKIAQGIKPETGGKKLKGVEGPVE